MKDRIWISNQLKIICSLLFQYKFQTEIPNWIIIDKYADPSNSLLDNDEFFTV